LRSGIEEILFAREPFPIFVFEVNVTACNMDDSGVELTDQTERPPTQIGCGAMNQRLKPSWRHQGIVIDKNSVFRPDLLQTEIARLIGRDVMFCGY
jgi:hypothetical protein